MKKRLWLLMLAGVWTVTALAQSSVVKQINKIKLDDRYFYAEATMDTKEAARESAVLMLANYINDYINENNLPKESKVTEQDLADAPDIDMKRGTMMRVFVYVEKSKFVPVPDAPAATDVAQAESPVPAGQPALPADTSQPQNDVADNATAATDATTADATAAAPQSAVPQGAAAESAPASAPAEQQTASSGKSEGEDSNLLYEMMMMGLLDSDSDDKSADSSQPSESSQPAGNPQPTSAEPAAQPAVSSSQMAALKSWQQDVITRLQGTKNMQGVVLMLNRLKGEYRVKNFGTIRECRNAAASYWVICDSDTNMTLLAILGPGADTRPNFISGQDDSLGNYSGKNAIWFEMAQ